METSQLEKVIFQYEHDFFSYAFCSNIENLENRFADEFVECGISGIYTRNDEINSLSKITADRKISISNFCIKILHDTVVLARYEAYMNEINRRSFHSSIWQNINDDWKIIYHQATKLNEPKEAEQKNKLENVDFAKIAPYFDWVQKVCAEKNIVPGEKITQIKDAKLFCISSSVGDLYLKKTNSFINDELSFTLKLMELGIIALPEWIGYDHDMKVCLMRDMGGNDLSLLPSLDMETAINMFISLSRIQKDSVQYVKSKDILGFDYRIGTMLEEMRELPDTAYKILADTQYRLTQEETEKLRRNTDHARTVLESIKGVILPDTIHHGDLGAYNVRVVDGKCIFYDWGCGGVSHPFFDTFRLLSSISGKLPTDVPAKEIILDTYLREWSEYKSHGELKSIFSAIDGLAGFYMMYCKYIRARNLHRVYAKNKETINTDACGLNHRYSTAATYLKRFIENDF